MEAVFSVRTVDCKISIKKIEHLYNLTITQGGKESVIKDLNHTDLRHMADLIKAVI